MRAIKLTAPLFFLLAVGAAAARAEVKAADLVGTWSGKMSITMGKETKDAPVKLAFTADGKVSITPADKPAQSTTYTIDKDGILLKDPDGKGDDVRLTNVKVSKTDFDADLAPIKGAGPDGPKLHLSLKKQ